MSRSRRPFQPPDSVFRGMAKLALGGLAARLIGIITVPVIARIYSPADFGILSVYVSIVQIALPMMGLRYSVAIPLPRSDTMALNVFALSGLLGLAFTSAIGLALVLIGADLLSLFSADALGPWAWLVAVGVLTAGAAELLGAWATRKRAYNRMAVNSVTILVVGESVKIVFGLLGFKPFGLLFGQMANQSGGVISFTLAFWADLSKIPVLVTWRRMFMAARRYWSYPALRLPSQFLLSFAIQAPLLYTARIYGVSVSGQFGLALMVLAIPVNVIGQAMGKAYYAEIARIGRSRPREILALTKKVQMRLFFAGVFPALALMFFGEAIFVLAFGQGWREAGRYSSILSLYVLLQFTSAPLIQLLNVFNKQGVFLIINSVRAALIVALFWFATAYTISMVDYVRIYSYLMAGIYAIITAYVFFVASRASRNDRC